MTVFFWFLRFKSISKSQIYLFVKKSIIKKLKKYNARPVTMRLQCKLVQSFLLCGAFILEARHFLRLPVYLLFISLNIFIRMPDLEIQTKTKHFSRRYFFNKSSSEYFKNFLIIKIYLDFLLLGLFMTHAVILCFPLFLLGAFLRTLIVIFPINIQCHPFYL